jgi:hypothetical protein
MWSLCLGPVEPTDTPGCAHCGICHTWLVHPVPCVWCCLVLLAMLCCALIRSFVVCLLCPFFVSPFASQCGHCAHGKGGRGVTSTVCCVDVPSTFRVIAVVPQLCSRYILAFILVFGETVRLLPVLPVNLRCTVTLQFSNSRFPLARWKAHLSGNRNQRDTSLTAAACIPVSVLHGQRELLHNKW